MATLADGVLEGVAILQVGHLLVPVLGAQAAEVGPGDERGVGVNFEGGLEHEAGVARFVGLWLAPVDEEDRHGARSPGNALLERPATYTGRTESTTWSPSLWGTSCATGGPALGRGRLISSRRGVRCQRTDAGLPLSSTSATPSSRRR